MESSQILHSPDKLLNARQVAQRLNISKAFAYKLMQMGKIRTVKIEGARRVRQEDLESYIEENTDPQLIF